MPEGGGGARSGFEPTRPATHSNTAPPVWRAPEGPEGQAAVPEGGGGARAGLEIDHSEPSGSRVAISRAGRRPPAHTAARPFKAGHEAAGDLAGHAAPGTPAAPHVTPPEGGQKESPTTPGMP